MFNLDLQLILATTAIIEFAVHWLLQSSLLIAAGLVLGGLLSRRGSAVQSVVYRTVLVAVLICPLATWGLSQAGISGWSVKLPREWGQDQPAAETIAENTVPLSTKQISSEVNENFAKGVLPRGPSPITPPTFKADLPREVPNKPAPPKNAFGFLALVLATAWLIVTVSLSARLATAWRRLTRVRRGASAAEPETVHTCRELATALGVPSPEVLRSPCLPSPCLAGLRRPVILLPEDDAGISIREVLLHELAHLKRHDCHWNLLRQIATAVFFFQPLLWKLSRRLEATAEEVCDDYVVQFGGNRQEYAHRLVDIAELSSAPIAAAGVGIVSLRSMLA